MTISNDGKISVIAPLSQPIVDYTTGMPTKAFADFIFNMSLTASKTDSNVTNINNIDNSVTWMGSTVNGIGTTVTNINTTVNNQGTTLTNLGNTVSTVNTSVSGLQSTVSSLSTTVAGNTAAISTETTTRANADSALSGQITTLSSTVGSHSASISTITGSLNGVYNYYAVKMNTDGTVSGFELIGGGGGGTFTFKNTSLVGSKISASEYVTVSASSSSAPPMTSLNNGSVAAIKGDNAGTGHAISGQAVSGHGVTGYSTSGYGGYFTSTGSYALVTQGNAYINGNLSVTGTISGTHTVASADKLTNARTIGGVSFDGTANINLPGVNTTGTQNTSGSSASCTGNAASASVAGSCTGNAATASYAYNAAGATVALNCSGNSNTATYLTNSPHNYNFGWSGANLIAYVDGWNSGTLAYVSDYRIKKNVTTQTRSAITRIMALRPVTYEIKDFGTLYKADNVTREGFIAHEVAEIIPSGVEGEKDAENQTQTLRIDAIVSVLTKAIQEQQDIIQSLTDRIEALESA